MDVSCCQVKKDKHFSCIMCVILLIVQPHQDGSLKNVASFSLMMDHAVLVQHTVQLKGNLINACG